jgi:UDP-N-acetylglucosamine--N-acetylmuramyl-(pentapeptide) pyrophosphoryl-undecaprenol N-acetylglucosamine transferase
MTRLMLASTGGHLVELLHLAPRLEPAADEVWVTFDTPQSRTLLQDRKVEWIPHTKPRDYVNVARNVGTAWRLLRRHKPRELVTSGAGIALSFGPLAVAHGVDTHYIESAARTDSPSTTGRVLERVPGIRLYAQHPNKMSSQRWGFSGSVFDRFGAEAVDRYPQVDKVVVTVGSMEFSFSRLFDGLRDVIPVTAEVVIQAGADADTLEWPGARIERSMRPNDLAGELASADVVISHSGVGSALTALEAGKMPIVVPRLHAFDEHVDDHQLEIAHALSERGLAVHRDAASITAEDLRRAASHRVSVTDQARPFQLR